MTLALKEQFAQYGIRLKQITISEILIPAELQLYLEKRGQQVPDVWRGDADENSMGGEAYGDESSDRIDKPVDMVLNSRSEPLLFLVLPHGKRHITLHQLYTMVGGGRLPAGAGVWVRDGNGWETSGTPDEILKMLGDLLPPPEPDG